MSKRRDDDVEFKDLNFDTSAFDISPDGGDIDFDMKDKRKPVEIALSSAYGAAKDKIVDKAFFRRMVELAIPKGYSQALTAADDLLEAVNKTITENKDGLEPHLRRLDKSIKNPALKRLLPKAARDILEDKKSSYSYGSGESQLDRDISALNELFKLDATTKLQERVEHAESEQRASRRHDATMAAQTAIARGIGRLVGYQDNILINYHRRNLEIGMRQLDVQVRLFEEQRRSNETVIAVLEAIRHNSALPDFVKMTKGEAIRERIRQRLLDSAENTVSNWSSNYFGNLQKNASGMLGGLLDTLSIVDMADSVGMTRSQAAGQALGALGGSLLTQPIEMILSQLAGAVGDKIDVNPRLEKFRKLGGKLQGYLTGLPQQLNEFAKSETEVTGVKGYLIESLKSLLDRHTASNTISAPSFEDLDKPAYMDQMFHRSVTEIIPGFLSSIERWTRLSATGEDAGERRYSFYEGTFTSREEYNRQHLEVTLKENTGFSLRNDIDQLISEIGGDGLSTPALRALRRRLLYDMSSINDFKPARYVKHETWSKESPDVAEELIDFFADTFELDIEGNSSGSESSMLKYLKVRDNFIETSKRLKDYPARMQALAPQVSRQVWRDLGLTEFNKVDGDVVKFGRLYDLLLGDTDGGLSYSEKKQDSLKGMSASERLKHLAKSRFEALQEERRKQANAIVDITESGEIFKDERFSAFGQGGRGVLNIGSVNVDLPDLFETADRETHERLDRVIKRIDDVAISTQATVDVGDSIANILKNLNFGSAGGGSGHDYLGDALDRISGGYTNLKGRMRSRYAALKERYKEKRARFDESELGKKFENLKQRFGDIDFKSLREKVGDVSLDDILDQIDEVKKKFPNIDFMGLRDKFGNITLEELHGHYEEAKQAARQRFSKVTGGMGEYYQRVRNEWKRWRESRKDSQQGRDGEIRLGGILKYGWKGGSWTAKKAAQGLWWYTKTAYKGIGKGLKYGWKGGVGVKNILFDKRAGFGAFDIYEPGNPEPLLTAKEIESGTLFDVNSKKAIKSVKDITGPVVDLNGNMRITQAQFDNGLINGYGDSVVSYLGKMAGKAALGLARFTTWYTTSVYGAMGRMAAKGIKLLHNQFVQADAYFPGEPEPRLTWKLLKAGMYCKADGTPITSYDEIDGAVYLVTNMDAAVITDEDIRTHGSMYTRNGSLLFTFGRGVVSVAKWAGQMAIKGARAYGRAIVKTSKFLVGAARNFYEGLRSGFWKRKGMRNTVSNFSGDMAELSLDIGFEQLRTQRSILDILSSQFGGKDKWDSDGDGIRENSWRDILRRRREKAAAAAGVPVGDNADVVAALEKLGKQLDKNFDELGDRVEEANEDGLLDQAADLAEIRDGFRRDKGGRGSKGTKKPGLIRRGIGALGRGALALGRGALALGSGSLGLVKGAGMVAAGVGKGLLAVGSAIGSVLSAPVILGAAVVAGVAAIGYFGYKWYTKSKAKEFPYFYLRMVQYGVDPRDEDKVAQILQLEDLVKGAVEIDQENGTAVLHARRIDMNKVFEIFKVDPDTPSPRRHGLLSWVSQRFRPVFLAHTTAAKRFLGTTELKELDEKMRKEDAEAFLTITNLVDYAHVYDNTELSPFDGELDMDADDVKEAVENLKSKSIIVEGNKKYTQLPLPENPVVVKKNEVASTPVVAQGSTDPIPGVKPLPLPGRGGMGETEMSVAGDTGDAGRYGRQILATGVDFVVSKAEGGVSKIDPATAARYKIYGLSTLEQSKVRRLARLETVAFKYLRVTAAGAKLEVSIDEFAVLAEGIFASFKDVDKYRLRKWLDYRFIPAFLAYAVGVRKRFDGDISTASDKMSNADLKEVIAEMSNTTVIYEGKEVSVWEITVSPWPGGAVAMATSPSVIDLEMAALSSEKNEKVVDVIGVSPTVAKAEPVENRVSGGTDTARANTATAQDVDPKPVFKPTLTSTGAPGLQTKKVTPKGEPVKHPGGAVAGDINSIPTPTGDGPDGVRATITAAAKMLGFDPDVAMTIAGMQSNWRVGAGAGTSSAKGLFQFLDGTWKEMLDKYGKKFGIDPNTSPFDARANALLGIQYLIDHQKSLGSKYDKVTDLLLYKTHFLGQRGVSRFEAAADDTPADQVVSAQAIEKNKGIFFDKSGRIRTVKEVNELLEAKMKAIRNMHGGVYSEVSGGGSSGSIVTEPKDLPPAEAPPPTPAEADAAAMADGGRAYRSSGWQQHVPYSSAAVGYNLSPSETAEVRNTANALPGPVAVKRSSDTPEKPITSPTKMAAQQAQKTAAKKMAENAEANAERLGEVVNLLMSMDGTLKSILSRIPDPGKQPKHQPPSMTELQTANAKPTVPKQVHSTARRNAVT